MAQVRDRDQDGAQVGVRALARLEALHNPTVLKLYKVPPTRSFTMSHRFEALQNHRSEALQNYRFKALQSPTASKLHTVPPSRSFTTSRSSNAQSSDDVFQEISARCRAVEPSSGVKVIPRRARPRLAGPGPHSLEVLQSPGPATSSSESCIVKSVRSHRSFISSPFWTPQVYGPTS